ncbi:MAG: hypothetical protein D6794_02485 [Deltaproteobacteria bacterium]|nr:MAG: hypothetical protein D6794_02485 [Deltaproteobacteria bacterium]
MMAGLFGLSLFSNAACAQDLNIKGDMGVFSQYMWRGMQASPNASVQGDLGVDAGNGLSANVWFAAPLGNVASGGNATEFDFTVDYSGEVSGLSYSVGAIGYTYLNAASGNAAELYLGVGYGPASLTYYYAVSGSWKKDAYLDLGLSTSLFGFDLGADFGFYLPSRSAANPTAFPTTKNELGHVDLSVSKDVDIAGVTMTPSLLMSIPTYTGKPKNANQFVAGLNFSY